MEAFRDVRLIADRMVARGDQVLVSAEGRGTGRATELPVSRRVFHLWTFSGGRAVRIEGFWDEDEALRKAGIGPDFAPEHEPGN
jgi:ketosteroid isomerase-like protein